MCFFGKKEYIVLVWSFILPLLLYDGAIDSFAPLHTVPIYEICDKAHFNDSLLSKTLGFYISGSIMSLITGISPDQMIYLPIQLFPSILMFFILVRELSNNAAFASLLTLLYSISDTSGNKFLFWVHGLGLIIFFLIIYLLIKKYVTQKNIETSILLFISLFTIVFLSYDLTFQILILLPVLHAILYRVEKDKKILHSFFNLFLYLCIIQLGISTFLYELLIPQLIKTESIFYSINSFFFSFFNTHQGQYVLRDFAIVYPISITIVNSLKYLLLIISIITCLIFIYHRFNRFKRIEYEYGVFLAFLISSICYFLIKLKIGQFAIGVFFYPGIISICSVYKLSKDIPLLKRLALFTVITLILLTAINYFTYYDNNLINKTQDNFAYLKPSAEWYWDYSTGFGMSDVQTNNLFYMHFTKKMLQTNEDFKTIHYYLDVFDPLNSKFPTFKEKSTSTNLKYSLLNNELQTITINKWIVLKPWSYFNSKVENNTDQNKIYNSNYIVILSNRNYA